MKRNIVLTLSTIGILLLGSAGCDNKSKMNGFVSPEAQQEAQKKAIQSNPHIPPAAQQAILQQQETLANRRPGETAASSGAPASGPGKPGAAPDKPGATPASP